VEEWGHRLHGDIPGSELHLLDDCGHFAMEDQLERISALLLDFLHRNG
jgi:pimeloyl-ACP methyl ester carboxylesterase